MIAHNSRIKRNCDYTQLIKVTRHLRIFLMQQIFRRREPLNEQSYRSSPVF